MAIDFMVMPLSRYLAGDFVTPQMRAAWDSGVPYFILGPQGRRDFPRDVPFGGSDAATNRARFIPMVVEDLSLLPIPNGAWDEASNVEPVFHRVDATSYQALLQHLATQPRSLLDLLPWKANRDHAAASLFLPCEFSKVLSMTSPFERQVASVPRALEVLTSKSWTSELASAAVTLMDALRDASRLRLPLIVDS
jgi:hypothetical protein